MFSNQPRCTKTTLKSYVIKNNDTSLFTITKMYYLRKIIKYC